MRTFVVVLAFFLAVPLASGTFQPTREVDFWRSTGFDWAQAKRFFSNASCRANPELYAACAEAFVQAGALTGTAEFRYLPSTSLNVVPAVDFDKLLARVEELGSRDGARFPKEMIYGSMTNTLLREFDSHASLLPAEYLNAIYAGPMRDTSGIGIEEEINGEGLFIRRVYKASPAEVAGLKVNDRILSIDGEPVLPGMKATKAMRRLAVSAGTIVQLRIGRRGELFTVHVPIAHLSLPDVVLDFPQFGQTTFAVATLHTFGRGVCSSLREQLSLVKSQVKGVVLDLRGNLGGALDEAACVMSLFTKQTAFVEKQAIKSPLPALELGLSLTFGKDQQNLWRAGLTSTEFETLPLTLLVNASSASASEMLAAALQDHHRAWIVGEPTFGEGSTQGVIADSVNPKLRLLYTVSRYYRPSGGPIQLIGVTPNFIVPFEHLATALEREFPREADIYGNKLQRENAPAWKETRKPEIKAMRRCLKRSNPWFNSALRKKTGYEDFQKATSLGILHCSPTANAT